MRENVLLHVKEEHLPQQVNPWGLAHNKTLQGTMYWLFPVVETIYAIE